MNVDLCNGCGGPHPFDVTVPSGLWNLVIRRGGPEHDKEHLCMTCIVRAFAEAGYSFTCHLYSGGDGKFDGLPVTVLIGYGANLLESYRRVLVDLTQKACVPPQPSGDTRETALRALVDQWRTRAGDRGFTLVELARSEGDRDCADELEALLTGKDPQP